MCQLDERPQLSCQCLPFQTSEMGDTMFISSVLLLHHPDLNSVKYEICIEIQQQVCLRNIHNVNGPTLWQDWHSFELRIINNATDKWCKRLCVLM